MSIHENIYDERHNFDPDHVLHVTTGPEGRLCLAMVDGEVGAELQITTEGVRKLRLALQRYERNQG